MRTLALAFAVFTGPLAAFQLAPADAHLAGPAQQIIRELYSLNHDRAEQLCRELIAGHPDQALGHAMLARALWARVLNNERTLSTERFAGVTSARGRNALAQSAPPGLRETFLDESRTAIEMARARLQANPRDRSALFVLGLTYLNMAGFEYALNRNLWGAFRNGERAVDAHRQVLRLEPSWGDPHLANGVALYLAGVLPWRVKWLAVLLGFARGRERGKREIEIAARDGVLLADDARTMLVLLEERDGQYDRAGATLRELHARYPRNFIVELEMAGLEMRRRRYPEAHAIYRRVLAKAVSNRDGYGRIDRPGLYNRLGIAARERGLVEEAAAHFRAALAHPAQSEATVPVSLLEMGKTLDVLGRRSEARTFYRQAAAAADVNGSRSEAQRFLRSPYASRR
jgi:tetratricopeptide (TPR) repeat protein